MAPQLRHYGVMELTPYVESVRRELIVAAAAGGDEAQALAERLVAPLESAMRLTLLNVLSAAANEITSELAPGSVDLRLRGLEPSFVVTVPPSDWPVEPDGAMVAPSEPAPVDEGTAARINFRPPEQLKLRIEEAAGKEGLSVNAWLIRAVTRVLSTGAGRGEGPKASGPQSFTGWVR